MLGTQWVTQVEWCKKDKEFEDWLMQVHGQYTILTKGGSDLNKVKGKDEPNDLHMNQHEQNYHMQDTQTQTWYVVSI